jgi:hypothetical protein
MTDIDDLFERAKEIPVPELATDVSRRVRSPGSPPGTDGPGHPPVRQRAMAVLVSLAVVGAAGALLWRASGSASDASSAPPGVSDVLRVRCDADSIEVLTPVVAAQADGLHVVATVSELSDPEIRLRSSVEPSYLQHWSGSSGVEGEFVRELAIGGATVHCESGPYQGDGPEDLTAPFTLVDPEGVFVEYRLACSNEVHFGPPQVDEWMNDGPPSESLDLDNPEELVRDMVSGILPDDIVERAGYVGGSPERPFVRVVRDGEIAGFFWLSRAGGRAHISLGRACVESGLSAA